jgi:hypothetical protein
MQVEVAAQLRPDQSQRGVTGGQHDVDASVEVGQRGVLVDKHDHGWYLRRLGQVAYDLKQVESDVKTFLRRARAEGLLDVGQGGFCRLGVLLIERVFQLSMFQLPKCGGQVHRPSSVELCAFWR